MIKLVTIISAILMTFVLFGLMAGMISADPQAVESTQNPPISFTMNVDFKKADVIDRRIKTEPPKLKPVESPPTKPTSAQPEPKAETKVALLPGTFRGVRTGIKLFNPDGGFGTQGNGIADAGLSARVQIRPSYPREAAMNNIEGYVTLSFDVDITGTPYNIQVLEAAPRGVFDRAAKMALAKWKYNPQMIDGRAVATNGQRITLEFNLSGDNL